MIFKQVVAILLLGISNSSIRGDGRHLNVLCHCRPIIEASNMWRNTVYTVYRGQRWGVKALERKGSRM